MKNTAANWYALLLGVLLLGAVQEAPAQELPLIFSHLSLEDGLSDDYNSFIYKDSRGFVWISSLDGLNRYDSREIKVYRPDPLDSTSIEDNRITSNFYEDAAGNLWFTTYKAVTCYRRTTDDFETYPLMDERGREITEDCYAFHLEDKEKVWVRTGLSTKGRLHIFNIRTGKDSIIGKLDGQRCKPVLDDRGRVLGIISSIFKDKAGIEWYAIENGSLGEARHFLPGYYISGVYADEFPHLWLASNNRGLLYFNIETGEIIPYPLIGRQPAGRLWSVIRKQDSVLLVSSSQNGLLEFNLKSRSYQRQYWADELDPNSLVSNNLNDLYIDPQRVLWVSIWGQGIDYASLEKTRFPILEPVRSVQGDHRIHSIVEDPAGRIWISMAQEGIHIYDQEARLLRRFDPARWNKRIEVIERLFPDSEGNVWVFASPKEDSETGQTLVFRFRPDLRFEYLTNVPSSVNGIRQLRDGRILITSHEGIYELDVNSRPTIVKRMPDFYTLESNVLNKIYEDSKHRLYINDNANRLMVYERKEPGFELIRDIPGIGWCFTFYEEKDRNRIWIATSTGLVLLDTDNFRTQLLTPAKGGPPNETYFSLLPDRERNLWLKSRTGLLKYNLKDSTILRYGKADGALRESSNEHAALKSSSGKFWISGKEGINVFDPQRIEPLNIQPKVLITNIMVNDEPLENGVSHPEIDSLRLPYKKNTVSFEYSANEFAAPGSNIFAYRLLGHDENWVEAADRPFTRYSNIPPGDYTFQLKATNSDGIWNDEIKSVQLSILPPWWQTPWARAGYVVLAIGIAFLIWYLEKERNKRKMALQAERLAQQEKVNRELKRVDRLKDQFLANTSHELRTPLHGIIGLTGNLIDGATGQLSDATMRQLAMIRASGKRLANLVNDILDFSKLKHRDIELNKRAVDIRTIADIVLHISAPLAATRGLRLQNKISPDFPLVDADENRLQQILFNLVGNAIKFTNKGEVSISATVKDRKAEIKVRDTGIGIPKDKQEDIFKWFEQAHGDADHNFGGTGIGLAVTRRLVELHGGKIGLQSREGIGTTFTFTLPLSTESVRDRTHTADPYEEEYLAGSMSAMVEEDEQPVHVTPIAGSTGIRIMVVDDEPINLQVIRDTLRMAGYRVKAFLDGRDALGKIEKGEHYDLLILDIMMPYVSGFEMCKSIREKYSRAELPIILLTSKNRVTDLTRGFELGANDYVSKPFSKTELLSRVKAHLSLLRFHEAASRFVPREFLRLIGKEDIQEVRRGDHTVCTVTVLFGDIRGYTGISEKMDPEKNFNFINEYAGRMGPLIRQNKGFVNQYLGDGIMAIFPENAELALQAAIEMQREIGNFRMQQERNGEKSVQIGIGFHTGQLVLGIIGDDERSDPATLADTVNVASRLEGLTKHFGANIILSSDSFDKLKHDHKFHIRSLGRVNVKGKEEATEVYECVDGDAESVRARKIASVDQFHRALKLYLDREFYEAYGLFKEIVDNNPGDRVANHFMQKAVTYLHDGVPEGWTGAEKVL